MASWKLNHLINPFALRNSIWPDTVGIGAPPDGLFSRRRAEIKKNLENGLTVFFREGGAKP